jgi:electron transport complex protein RnfG
VSARPPALDGAEWIRIVVSMTVTMVIAAAVLGAVFLGTSRHLKAAELAHDRDTIDGMLQLDSTATLLEVQQYLLSERREVVYRAHPYGDASGPARELTFSLDGELRGQTQAAAAAGAAAPRDRVPLGRLFVARRGGALAGFVVEGVTRGYKNRIRFFVALDPGFEIQGVSVQEHEEDPGLGAEVATAWFQGQFVGRRAEALASLDVTKTPMPEDWRAALQTLARVPAPEWRARNQTLIERERAQPVYAVTGATISSRALTHGVRTTVEHFRKRWQLLAPYLGGPA